MIPQHAEREHPGWLVTLAAFLGQMAAALGFIATPLFAPALAERTGLDERDFAFAGTFVFLAVGLSSPYTGPLLRRLGSVRMLAAMLALMAAAYSVLALGTWTSTMASGFLFGLAYGMYGPANTTLVATRTPRARRGLFLALRQSGVTFAGVLAGRILPPVIVAFGLFAGVAVVSGTMLLAAVLTLVFASVFAIRQVDVGEPAAPPPAGRRGALARFIDGYRLPMPLQLFAFAAIGFAICHLGLASFAYFYLVEVLDFSEIAAGAFMSNLLLSATVGRALMGYAVDLTGSAVRVLAGIAFVGAASFVALLMLEPGTPWPYVVAVSVLAGLSANTWTGVFTAAISNAAPEGSVGDYNGRAFSYAALGWTLAAPIIWLMIEFFDGYTIPFCILMGLEVVIGCSLLALARLIEPQAEAP